ncbi:MAG: transketolase [Bacteroidetes bacterium]|nr:transketolase [Bacteroidota bacterium]MBL7103553.1 transketolase [Bacteroidales bacterium]
MDNTIVNKAADNIRILTIAMVEKAKSGHPGGAMGGADFINILYSEFLNFDPDDMAFPFRDRFFLDPGHMSPMLYSVLAMFGKYSIEDLKNFRQWQSPTPGHPEIDVKRGIENTSGPLGQGHAMAIGAAIAERFFAARFGEWMSHKIYTFISDGGIQEEISQGAGRIAGCLGLSNIIMFFDSNDIQLSTMVDEVTLEDTAKKYEAWGWRVVTINGNDPDEIREALKMANNENEKPFLIIGKTVMGKGCVTESGENFERMVSTHGQPVSKAGASVEKTILNLGGDPENPFIIFPGVKEFYEKVKEKKRKIIAEKNAAYITWQKKNPGLAQKLEKILSGEITNIDFSKIQIKPDSPTRSVSSIVLSEFSGKIENMIVMSADLSNSDKTEGFLKNTKPLKRGDFTGAFLHAGVSELTMTALANGMALHNIIPVCGTFFVFSDYMKPAIRMAALMELPVKYVWTHDSFRVGEDGPTHQPVEQEAQIRLMEKLKNHSGNNSMLVLRPADGAECLIAWKMALENKSTPTGLILSRQNIKDLPSKIQSDRYSDALDSYKGAYIIQKDEGKPDIILLASGSEVSTIIEGAELLRKKNSLKVQVVSVISEGVFRQQNIEYQKQVIPDNLPVLGLTAGLPATLSELVGANGKVIGLDHFGYSAPFKVLDEKFGFSGEDVYQHAINYLKEF